MGWQDAPAVTAAPQAKAQPKAGWEAAPTVTRAPGAKPKKSQALGFEKGLLRPATNLATWIDAGIDQNAPAMQRIKADYAAHPERFRGGPAVRDLIGQGWQNIHDREAAGEKPGLLGEIGGNLLGTVPVALITKNPLAVGAMQGALLSEHPDDAGAVAMDAGLGALLNKATGVAVDKAADILKPTIAPAVQLLKKAGVKLSPGQIKGGKALVREDRAMSRPIVGDAIAADRSAFTDSFNRGAVNRALMPLGVRLPDHIATGHEAVDWMQKAAGDAYDRVLPNLGLKPDARLAVGFRKAQMIAQGLPQAQQEAFLNLVRTNLDFNGQGGIMSGRTLTRGLRDLRTRAAGYSKSASEAERQLGAALGEIMSGVDSSLLAQNPKFAPMLKAANAAYRDSQVVNRAAAVADEGIASTGQLKTASRTVDRSKGKRATAAGRGPMQDYVSAGRAVAGKTPDSGTAGRLMDGKWIQTARGAIDRGLYEADKAMTGLRLVERPAAVKKLAGLLAQYRPEISAVGGPVVGGLLSGLLAND